MQNASEYQPVSIPVTMVALLSQLQTRAWLSRREYHLVDYLSGLRGRHATIAEIRDEIYGGVCDPGVVRTLVFRVRSKLGPAFIEQGIEGGYRIAAARADALVRRCSRCRGSVVTYPEQYVCFSCGAIAEKAMHTELAVDLDVGRAEYAEGSTSGKAWSDEERDYILARRNERNDRQIADELNRSPSGVRAERKRLERERGLPKKKYVSGDDGGDE